MYQHNEIIEYIKCKLLIQGREVKELQVFMRLSVHKFNQKYYNGEKFTQKEIDRMTLYFSDLEPIFKPKMFYDIIILYIVRNGTSWTALFGELGFSKYDRDEYWNFGFLNIPEKDKKKIINKLKERSMEERDVTVKSVMEDIKLLCEGNEFSDEQKLEIFEDLEVDFTPKMVIDWFYEHEDDSKLHEVLEGIPEWIEEISEERFLESLKTFSGSDIHRVRMSLRSDNRSVLKEIIEE